MGISCSKPTCETKQRKEKLTKAKHHSSPGFFTTIFNTKMKIRESVSRFCAESKIGQHCIHYDSLKQSMQAAIGKDGERDFVKLFNNELTRLKTFITLKLKELHISHRQLIYRTMPNLKSGKLSDNETFGGQRGKKLIDKFVENLKDLAKFTYLNSEAFANIIRKHDKIVGSTSTWYFVQNHEQFFCKVLSELDVFLYHASVIYDSVMRKLGEPYDLKDETVKSDDQINQEYFERKSAKYWVKPEDAFAVKAEIAKQLPIHVFRVEKPLQHSRLLEENAPERTRPPTTWVSSVYLDNSNLTCYHKRVRLEEGATLIRLRWYNTPHGVESLQIAGPVDQKVYVERKTHHESWIWENSVKERFLLNEDNVVGYIQGDSKSHPRNISNTKTFLAKDIQEQIKREGLRPILRTVYKRTAFQLPDNNDVRITVDTDFTMVDEDGHFDSTTEWKRHEKEILDRHDYRIFPLVILEVKLKAPPPQWLEALMESSLVRPVPKFSKFQFSAASFYPHKVNKLPYWYSDDDIKRNNEIYNKVITHPRSAEWSSHDMQPALTSGTLYSVSNDVSSTQSNAMTAESNKSPGIPQIPLNENKLINRLGLLPKFHGSNSDDEALKTKPIQRLKVEPKTYFANERTFIQWLTSSLLLVTLSGALVTLGDTDAQVTGLLFMPLAILILLYATVMFYLRLHRIKHNCKSGYHDVFGPAILTVFLCAAMMATFCLHFKSFSSSFSKNDLDLKDFRLLLQESDHCHRMQTKLPLFFEPSDVVLDPSGKFLWTCSGGVLAKIDLESEAVIEYILVSDKKKYDFEGLSFGNPLLPHIIYIAAEFPSNQILIYDLKTKQILEVVEMNQLLGRNPSFEGITYSDTTWNNHSFYQSSGTFFATSKDFIQIFSLNPDRSSSQLDPLPLQAIKTDAKIGALTVRNNTLFALLDNIHTLRAWDLRTAEKRDFPLPSASKQWEGIAFSPGGADISTSPDETAVYLAMDSPPQIWRLVFSDSIGFLEC